MAKALLFALHGGSKNIQHCLKEKTALPLHALRDILLTYEFCDLLQCIQVVHSRSLSPKLAFKMFTPPSYNYTL